MRKYFALRGFINIEAIMQEQRKNSAYMRLVANRDVGTKKF